MRCLIPLFLILPLVTGKAQTLNQNFPKIVLKTQSAISDILVLPDSKIMVIGRFDWSQDDRIKGIVRLNADGSRDNAFSFTPDNLEVVNKIIRQSNGNLVFFSNTRLVRLTPDGSLINQLALTSIAYITVQADDKILLIKGNILYRYNADLTPDTSFTTDILGSVYMAKYFDSKIYICGGAYLINSNTRYYVARLNLNGSLDETFNYPNSGSGDVRQIEVQSDGKVIIAAGFNVPSFKLLRLNSNGTQDISFPGTGSALVSKITYNNGKIIVVAGSKVFRFESNGTMDNNFTKIDTGDESFVPHIAMDEAGNFFAGSTFNVGNHLGLTKFNNQGAVLAAFNPALTSDGALYDAHFRNEKLIVAGSFIEINGFQTNGLAMLDKDGNIISSFRQNDFRPFQYTSFVETEILEDGSVLAACDGKLMQFTATGDLSGLFNHILSDPYGRDWATKFKVLKDGKILAGNTRNLFRLNSNGSMDNTFVVDHGPCCQDPFYFDFDLQADGKIIYGAKFTQLNGTAVNRLARINGTDGSIDQTFTIGTGPNNDPALNKTIRDVDVLSDDSMIILGGFSEFNGTPTPSNIVKLTASGAVDAGATTQLQNLSIFHIFQPVKDNVFLLSASVSGISFSVTDNAMLQFQEIDFPESLGSSSLRKIVPGSNAIYVIGYFTHEDQSQPDIIFKYDYTITSVTGEAEAYSVYPNPAEHTLRIKGLTGTDVVARVYTMDGRQSSVVLERKGDIHEAVISNLLPGAYLLQINQNRQLKSVRFIKK